VHPGQRCAPAAAAPSPLRLRAQSPLPYREREAHEPPRALQSLLARMPGARRGAASATSPGTGEVDGLGRPERARGQRRARVSAAALCIAVAVSAAIPAAAQVAHLPAGEGLGEGSRQPGDAPLPIPHAPPRMRAPADGRPWSVRFAESVMRRNPQTHRRWDYTQGVVLNAIERVALEKRDRAMLEYVNANMGRRADLTVLGVPVGRGIPDLMPKESTDGSIIIVVATDAPLDHLKCQRLASKAALGLARTGTIANHGSGDIFLAFSTGNRVPHYPKPLTYRLEVVADDHLDPIFRAAEEAAEEAILNALTMATTTVGRDGNTAYALPLDRLTDILRKAGRLR